MDALRKTIPVIFGILILTGFSGFQLVPLAIQTAEAEPSKRIVGNFPWWESEDIDSIDYSKLTDISYFHIWPNSDGSLDTSSVNINDLHTIRDRAHNAGVKVTISAGGWGASDGFPSIGQDASIRAIFISNMVNFISNNELDGMDLDWETPIDQTKIDQQDILLSELSNALHPLGKIVTVSVNGDTLELKPSAVNYVDWVNVMAYDMNWNNAEHSTFNDAVAALQRYENAGIPKEKLEMGIPFYGRDDTWSSAMKYEEIISACPLLQADDNYCNGHFFNGIDLVQQKTQYVLDNGYDGIMIWNLGQDTYDSTSLLNAINVVLDTTPVSQVIAVNDSYSTDENITLNVTTPGILGNDSDSEGDPMTAVLENNVANGSLTLDADGSFSYTPNTEFNGIDTFSYHATDGTINSNTATVTITVSQVNNSPIAFPDTYSAFEDITLNVSAPGVLGNDSDSDPLTAVLDLDVANGSLNLNSNGSFSYTPNHNFNGADSFSYHANDGTDDSDIVTVAITVFSVNDEPSFTASNQSVEENIGPVTIPGFAIFNPGAPNEAGQTATYTISNDNNVLFSSQPSVSPDGTLTFEPATDLTGSSIVTISVQDNGETVNGGDDTSSDQTFTITVNPLNDVYVEEFVVNTSGNKRWTGYVTTIVYSGVSPIENATVLGSWSGGESGTASCTTDENGQCQVLKATKNDSLTFTVDSIAGDGLFYDPLEPDSITFDKNGNIPGANSPPEAVNDSANVLKGSSISINVVSNDSDDGSLDLSTITITQTPSNAFSLIDNYDGTLTYTHDGTDSISDSFKYTIKDNDGVTSNEATVSISIDELPQDTIVHLSSINGELSSKGPWNTFTVTIKVHDSTHSDQGGVTVSGTWSGITGPNSCTTDSNGTCSISTRDKNGGTISFTVIDMSGSGIEYNSAINEEDPEITFTVPLGKSNGANK